MTAWQPADLLGVHDYQFDLEKLPRQREVVDRRPPGADHDALTVMTALAQADSPLTAGQLALALSWSAPRLDAALDYPAPTPTSAGHPCSATSRPTGTPPPRRRVRIPRIVGDLCVQR